MRKTEDKAKPFTKHSSQLVNKIFTKKQNLNHHLNNLDNNKTISNQRFLTPKKRCEQCGEIITFYQLSNHMEKHQKQTENKKNQINNRGQQREIQRRLIQNIRAPHLEQAHATVMGMINIFDSMESANPSPSLIKDIGPAQIAVSKITHPREFDPDKRNCIICLNDFKYNEEGATLPCLHKFHTACLRKWFESKNTCPLCKFIIKNKTM